MWFSIVLYGPIVVQIFFTTVGTIGNIDFSHSMSENLGCAPLTKEM